MNVVVSAVSASSQAQTEAAGRACLTGAALLTGDASVIRVEAVRDGGPQQQVHKFLL